MGATVRHKKQCKGHNYNYFMIQIKLMHTNEIFDLTRVHNEMKISELKGHIELSTGVSTHIQRVSYLDEAELHDETTVRDNDIVPLSALQLRVFSMWIDLIQSVATNDINKVMEMGVTYPTDYRSPASDYMTKNDRKRWLQERSALALNIATCRGLEDICLHLIQIGADVNATTRCGRTALYIASACDRGDIINILLENGADVDIEDNYGETAFSVSEHFGLKSCGFRLTQFNFQRRLKKKVDVCNSPLMPHQKNDSLYPVWKKGPMAQVYLAHQGGHEEFEGTSLDAPVHSIHPSVKHKMIRDSLFFPNRGHASNVSLAEHAHHVSDGRDNMPGDILYESPTWSSSTHEKLMKRPISHSEWLQLVKKKEAKLRAITSSIKRDREKHRVEEEQRKSREQGSVHGMRMLKTQRSKHCLTHSATAASKLGGHGREVADPCVENRREPGYLRLYLRSLGMSSTGIPFEQWLDDRERDVLHASDTHGS